MFGKIVGTGSYVPENIVTNNDLTKIVETSTVGLRKEPALSKDTL